MGFNHIYHYIISDKNKIKSTIKNPYLEDLENLVYGCESENQALALLEEKRSSLVEKYSFSVPFPFVLDILVKYSPITEIGAGSGYYAYCLKQRGVDIEAFGQYSPDDFDSFDFMSSNYWFEDTWAVVLQGDESIASASAKRTLFLCWPPVESQMAFNSLVRFMDKGGKYFIFIGDSRLCAEKRFYDKLLKYKILFESEIPSWKNINERLVIYDLEEFR